MIEPWPDLCEFGNGISVESDVLRAVTGEVERVRAIYGFLTSVSLSISSTCAAATPEAVEFDGAHEHPGLLASGVCPEQPAPGPWRPIASGG